METLQSEYLRIRRRYGTPANYAIRAARHSLAQRARFGATGFEWDGNTAAWREAGFDFKVCLSLDENGWWEHGEDDIGRFSRHWKPGAMKHHRGDARSCGWFIPANPDYAKQDYDRACRYGDDWHYVVLTVVCSCAGVELARNALWGIESDSGEGYFTEVAFDLADQCVTDARQALSRLCQSP